MKTNELKACPFCGRNDRLIFEPLPGCTDVGNVACVCGASYTTITQGVDDWNTRPIEDGLRAEISALQKQVDELIKAGNALSKVVKKAHWLCGEPEVGRWHNLTGKIKKERE